MNSRDDRTVCGRISNILTKKLMKKEISYLIDEFIRLSDDNDSVKITEVVET